MAKAKIYLYKEGNECTSLTGGWKLYKHLDDAVFSYVEPTKSSSSIDCILTNTTNKVSSCGTTNPIAFELFDNIYYDLDIIYAKNLTNKFLMATRFTKQNTGFANDSNISTYASNIPAVGDIGRNLYKINLAEFVDYKYPCMTSLISATKGSVGFKMLNCYLETKENVLTINSQEDDNIIFSANDLGLVTISKIDVLVNGVVSKTYTDNYSNLSYTVDKSLYCIGNNNIEIRVTYSQGNDITETVSEYLTYKYDVSQLPLETPLLDTVERVKLLAKSKQNEKDILSSILTSKNVEVSEEDKMSDLIGKVDLLGEYDNPILWLYKDGIENVVFEILGSGITIDKFHFTGSGAYASKKVSTNTIDLTSYKTLKVEYGNCTTTKGTSYYPVIGFGVATTKQTGDNHLTSKTASSSSSQFSNSNSILSLDISNINGLYYIDIYVNSYAGATLDININKIWLEK